VRVDANWPENLAAAEANAAIAQRMGIPLVTFHAGFLPADRHDPARKTMVERLRTIDDLFVAHGISIALYNTAFGLVIAVPAMIFYRHFRAKVDHMLVDMELQAIKLVEIVHGERQA